MIRTREALRNVQTVRAYIRQFDPRAAERMAARLLATGDGLSHFSERDRPAADGRREPPTVAPYIVRYRVQGDAVDILRVRHGAWRPD